MPSLPVWSVLVRVASMSVTSTAPSITVIIARSIFSSIRVLFLLFSLQFDLVFQRHSDLSVVNFVPAISDFSSCSIILMTLLVLRVKTAVISQLIYCSVERFESFRMLVNVQPIIFHCYLPVSDALIRFPNLLPHISDKNRFFSESTFPVTKHNNIILGWLVLFRCQEILFHVYQPCYSTLDMHVKCLLHNYKKMFVEQIAERCWLIRPEGERRLVVSVVVSLQGYPISGMWCASAFY